MKKTFIFSALGLLISFNSIASVNPKKSLFKLMKPKEVVLIWDCDADYNFMVSSAEYNLWLNLTYPPSNANSFYYTAVWDNYNGSVKAASAYRKACKLMSAE